VKQEVHEVKQEMHGVSRTKELKFFLLIVQSSPGCEAWTSFVRRCWGTVSSV